MEITDVGRDQKTWIHLVLCIRSRLILLEVRLQLIQRLLLLLLQLPSKILIPITPIFYLHIQTHYFNLLTNIEDLTPVLALSTALSQVIR